MIVKFYMRGGHAIIVDGVEELTMTRDPSGTGAYGSYRITWEDGKQPKLFTLSIPDIVAVFADEPRKLSFLQVIGLKK